MKLGTHHTEDLAVMLDTPKEKERGNDDVETAEVGVVSTSHQHPLTIQNPPGIHSVGAADLYSSLVG